LSNSENLNNFCDAIKSLTYDEMMEVSQWITDNIEEYGFTNTPENMASCLNDYAENYLDHVL